jgi:acetyl-CoA acetyltransferase family protein
MGRNKGSLSKMHPCDLGAIVVDAVVERSGVPPASVDDVIFGCVGQYGAQSGNVARNVVLSSKLLPETVPGTTVDRQCGSSQQAVHFAAQAVMSGTQDVVIAGGVEVMSLIPIGSQIIDGMKVEPSRGQPYNGTGFPEKYGKKLEKVGLKMPSQFVGAELLVAKYKLTREELDSFAVASHAKAAEATAAGKFKKEIIPVGGLDKDEGIRPGTSLETLGKLKTMHPQGKLTPGTASQITDGAAAVMIVNDTALKKYNLKPLARIHTLALCGCDPIVMLEGPVFATQNALKKSGLKISDIDLYEVNEAFASVPLAWAKALNADLSRLNVNGSAMAIGHPLGATGARLFTTLVHEMERRQSRYGLVSICEGGGTANATIIERCGESAQKSKL